MSGSRSIMESLLINDRKKTSQAQLTKRKKVLRAELQDYIKYEKELKNRKGKKRNFGDREIDPKKIAAARKEAREMVRNGLVDKDYFNITSKDELKIKKKKKDD